MVIKPVIMYVDTPTKQKRVVRRNLPINDKYTLIDSFYSSMENGNCCDNCNKIIANIAVIKNDNNKQYYVGMDCAETLTRLDGLYNAQLQFAESKAIRAKINKAIKDGKQVEFKNTCLGQILISFNGMSSIWLNYEFIAKYLPDYLPKILNPDKNNYPAIAEIEYNTQGHLEAKEFYKTAAKHKYNELDIIIYLTDGKKIDGTPNGSIVFTVDILKDRQTIATTSTYMAKDINSRINYQLNTYYFNKFNT